MALKCSPHPSNRGGGEGERGERKRSERQTRGEGRESAECGPAADSAPAGIVCAARAPSPAPHGPATHTLRRSPAVRLRLCPQPPPEKGEQPSGTCSPGGGRGTERAGEHPTTHPANPAAGRVLLIHFPLALARPGRRRRGGARRKWALRSGGRSGPVRAPGGVRTRAGLRGAPPRD